MLAVTTVYKPAGVPVFPPHDDPDGDCVLARLPKSDTAWPQGFEGGIAHRLDNETSGALLVAGDLASLATLRGWFAGGHLRKTYRLLAAKDVPWRENRCDRSIAHDRSHRGRMVVQRGPDTPHRGKWYPADTAFIHIDGRLWEAILTTGVMHQIRVHAAFVGIPLAGDRRYGGGEGTFSLHHVGVRGPDGFTSASVPTPDWAL